jgi:long-chain acyl-CoA synthetase
MNLVRAFRTAVRHNAPNPALHDAARSYTWAEFGDRVARLAGALRALGIERGARFAILARNGFRGDELRWAGFWLGAIPVPINFRLAPPEIAHILEDAACVKVFVEAPFQGALEHAALAAWRGRAVAIGEASGANAEPYETMLARAAPVAPNDPDRDEDAILLYTGGTTGRSKGVRLSHEGILASSFAFALGTGARREHVYLRAAPMFHSADLLPLGWQLQGAASVFLPMFSPAAWLEAVARWRVGATITVPTMLIGIVSAPNFAQADVSSMKVLIYGAAPLPLPWIERAAKAFPKADFFNCYGLTETSPDLTIFDAREFHEAIERGLPHVTSVGKPNVVNELRVVRADGSECPTGEPGELIARGPNVMLGYLNRPEETAEALRDGWLHTGDVARVDEAGYIYLIDRLKDVVRTGGESVYSAEVEAVLERHPAIAEVAVIGVPDERLGETVAAVIVAKPGAAAPAEAELDAYCRESLGGFKVPRRFFFAEQLPKSALGKVLKSDLRQRFGAKPEKR